MDTYIIVHVFYGPIQHSNYLHKKLNILFLTKANLKNSLIFHQSAQQNEHDRNRFSQLYDPHFSEGNSILEVCI